MSLTMTYGTFFDTQRGPAAVFVVHIVEEVLKNFCTGARDAFKVFVLSLSVEATHSQDRCQHTAIPV